jgi:hypothetical protein
MLVASVMVITSLKEKTGITTRTGRIPSGLKERVKGIIWFGIQELGMSLKGA